jgi:hypothetical protein
MTISFMDPDMLPSLREEEKHINISPKFSLFSAAQLVHLEIDGVV